MCVNIHRFFHPVGFSRSVRAKRKPGSLQEYFSRALREDPFSAPNTNKPRAPLVLFATHPPNQICSGSALLRVSLLRFFCSTLSAAHTPTVPQAFLFTLAQMCAFTFGYFLVISSLFIIIEHLESMYTFEISSSVQIQKKIVLFFNVFQSRCVGRSHLEPQMDQSVDGCCVAQG